jgi:mono/diheme cytochrome c family protein
MRIWLLIFIFSLGLTQLQSAPKSVRYERELNFKDVHHGELAKVSTLLFNTGATDVFVDRIKNSCGCTTVELKDKTVPANGLLQLDFIIDTLQKVGEIRKSAKVYFKNDTRPLTIYISGKILPQPKGHMMHHEKKSIFSEKCASCHVIPGHKLTGKSLYLADCAMCHGTLRQGASAPPLLPSLYNPTWEESINKGKGNMIGFGHEHGGPLNDNQLKSLIEYLKPQEDSDQAYRSKSPALLYYRWCSACHGNEKMGPIGPDIRSQNLKHYTVESLAEFLKKNNTPLMPSFHVDQNGPFDEQELINLAKYLIGPRP